MTRFAINCLSLCGGLFLLLAPGWIIAGEVRQSRESIATAPQALDIYLLLGQSNMVGMEKKYLAEDQTPHPRVFVLNSHQAWVPAREPLHGVGVGPGPSFGKAIAHHDPHARIGLIPLAVGSTPISKWIKGGPYYAVALAQAKFARRNGTLRGILWHQGESDSYDPKLAAAYAGQLSRLVEDLRRDLNQPDLPFVCGQLGQFLKSPFAGKVNEALLDLPNHRSGVAVVDSQGLTNMDPWHFNATSARTLGQRYAAAMIGLQTRPAPARPLKTHLSHTP